MQKVFCDICGKEKKVDYAIYVCKDTFDICDDCQKLIRDFFKDPQEAKKVIDIYFQSRRENCENNLLKAIEGDKK